MFSKIAEFNLKRDKNVQGKRWLLTYGNWFSDKQNIKSFINAVIPFLPKKELDILYVASASGLLGENLLMTLGKGTLTLVDISKEHLDENDNPTTEKICGDLLKMSLKRKFDLVIMRSSLDYFPSEDLQIKVLKIIKDHIKDNGIFVNQPAYISDLKERNSISEAYNTVDKIGKRFFQSSDISSIYAKAGFGTPQRIGESKAMYLTEQDHTKRYGLDMSDISVIQRIIKEAKHNTQVTSSGYSLKFEFPIFLVKNR